MIYIFILLIIGLIIYLLQQNVESFNNMDEQDEAFYNKYILKTEIPKCPKPIDKNKYILKTEIPKCPKPIDKNKYILKTELNKYLSKVPNCYKNNIVPNNIVPNNIVPNNIVPNKCPIPSNYLNNYTSYVSFN